MPHGRTGTAAWQEACTAEEHIGEAFINYLFLSAGRLKQVENRENDDPLGNFEYACAAVASQVAGRSDPSQPNLGKPEVSDDSPTLSDSEK